MKKYNPEHHSNIPKNIRIELLTDYKTNLSSLTDEQIYDTYMDWYFSDNPSGYIDDLIEQVKPKA